MGIQTVWRNITERQVVLFPHIIPFTDKQVINAARRWNCLSPLYIIYYDPDLDPEPWNKIIPRSEVNANADSDTHAKDEDGDEEHDGESDDGYETAEESFEDKIQTPEVDRVIRNRKESLFSKSWQLWPMLDPS